MTQNKYIIIPTYNERGNIEKLLQEIFALEIENLLVLVVDDNSPDGTGELAEKLKTKFSGLEILHRQKKEGLGRAYIAGFKYALERGAAVILHLDADFSHDPKYIPEFFRQIENYDLVLGSRYTKGGGTKNWNLARRLISKSGNLYARIILGLPPKDVTGGFKCYRRDVLEKIDLDNLNSIGYCFMIETTYRAWRAGFKIKEVPIIFVERAAGKSKFDLGIILESFLKVIKLKINN